MSRRVYTYTDLKKINASPNFHELIKYPQITVSADLRKCINGSVDIGVMRDFASATGEIRVTDFQTLANAIDRDRASVRSKFFETLILSEFLRRKIEEAGNDKRRRYWLTGCMRNLDSMLSSVILLEQAGVKPEDFSEAKDRNFELFIEAWEYLIEKDPVIRYFRARMERLDSKQAWRTVLKKAFNTDFAEDIDTLVFHGFYYFTPFQERVMQQLEKAGFELVFLIPYDERFPSVYEIWDQTYNVERGYEPKAHWHIEKASDEDQIGGIFEGRHSQISSHLTINEYTSALDFVNDIKRMRPKGASLYSPDHKRANKILKEFFPEEYGDRNLLSYAIGHFVRTLNGLWDPEKKSVCIEQDDVIECFLSGWLSSDGVSGKKYMQDLFYVLPFFNGCRSTQDWRSRTELLREIERSALSSFKTDRDPAESISRWQEAVDNPLKNFSIYAVEPDRLDIVLQLILQVIDMAEELFDSSKPVSILDYMGRLDRILKRCETSNELYSEERELICDIFETLSEHDGFDALCYPEDISDALELYICGRFEEGETQPGRVEMVSPLHFIDSACAKNEGKVHVCLCDADSLPGRNKDYVWPLTGKKLKEVYASTNNPYILNIIQIMESAILCCRYFIYCALKNTDVTLSWISSTDEKPLAPSPYIRLLAAASAIKINTVKRAAISEDTVKNMPEIQGKIKTYEINKAPSGMVKEAEIDRSLCPMKYILGYVVEKFPAFQSDFQINYALNALISAIFNLMKDKGVTVDKAYESVIGLFPGLRKAEKRQVYDYISYKQTEEDIDYTDITEIGGRLYTDQRLKIHYPNRDAREAAYIHWQKDEMPQEISWRDLCRSAIQIDDCSFCQHISCCRYAKFALDQENYYD